jgi:hypothetical protein
MCSGCGKRSSGMGARSRARRPARAAEQDELPGAEGMVKLEYQGDTSARFRGKSGALYVFNADHLQLWVIASDAPGIMLQDKDHALTFARVEEQSGIPAS